jgi:hypothetical protein
MTPHFFWLAQVEAFRIGTVDILPNQVIKAYQVQSMTKAILDTGTSLFYVPANAWSKFIYTLMEPLTGYWQ